ncbi:MAG: SDR family NAD(P)-dependent oxidoreductase [Acetivibrionales bacterium]|jgi:acyl transferase domain-containing protein/acyl carrier protein/SAM-dependent methyltransferase
MSDSLHTGNLLIFDSGNKLCDALKNRHTGKRAVLVRPGTRYRHVDKHVYEINPSEKDDYIRLFESLEHLGLLPGHVIHLWSRGTFVPDEDTIKKRLDLSGYSVLFLAQMLIKHVPEEKVRFLYIYMQEQGQVQPEYAAADGMIRSIRLENPELDIRTIELELSARQALTAGDILDILLSELKQQNGDDIQIRYKDGRRQVKLLRECDTCEKISMMQPDIKLREAGVYLISGGAGGLGLIFADYLAKEYRAGLALVGRSPLSAEKQAKLRELEDYGAEVMYIRADISKKEDAEMAISKVKSRFGTINGVIHGAGIIRDNLAARKTRQEIEDVLAPKVFGTVWLDEAAKEEKLDFFAMFSSISAVRGNIGQSDYAYGNGFMDHYAVMREQLRQNGKRSGKTISINWPLWKDGGMKVDPDTEKMFAASFGMTPMNTETGLHAFLKGLACPESSLLVVEGERSRLRHALGISNLHVEVCEEDRGEASKTDHVSMIQLLNDDIVNLVSDMMKISKNEIDLNADMSELGFDSITFTRLSNKINEKYDLEIMPSIFFECSSLASFTGYMEQNFRDRLEKYYRRSLAEDNTMSGGKDELGVLLRRDLTDMVCNILKTGKDEIEPDVGFSEFGFDSILLTRLGNCINEKYGLNLMPSIFFEHSTLEALAQYLASEHMKDLAGYYFREPLTRPEMTGGAGRQDITARSAVLRVKGSRFMTQGRRIKCSGFAEFNSEPVAIIGMSGQMPQSRNLDEFWRNLEDGRSLITEIPGGRWDWETAGEAGADEDISKLGGFLNEIDKFDPLFFSISPKEAEMMDPQQRLFMETVWKTIEDAGYKASDLSGTRTGVFVGVATSDYYDLLREYNPEIQLQTSTGISHAMLANRISYLLNLKGPSEPVDTACSSSLVAIHRAVEAIQLGNCDMAIAGGVNILISPTFFIAFSKAGMLSKDGKCKTFDKDADGYVRGEGVGAILLKPLNKAIEDGDNIYAVIRGSAVNHGGRANSLTAPNPVAQAEVISKAWEKAQVDPSTISYIEAHGTGTSLGDPVEINGLKKAFEQLYGKWDRDMDDKPCCGIGSVKTNIGHLETAAGIAGVLKVLLAFKNKKIPASINFKELNPYIQLEGSPLFIVNKTIPWNNLTDEEGNIIPRRAGVSSFGYGGVNAHIALEEHIEEDNEAYTRYMGKQLAVLSAKNEDRLREYAGKLADFLFDKFMGENSSSSRDSLVGIAYTLQVGREEMDERIALVVSDVEELAVKLRLFAQYNNDIEGLYHGNVKDNNIKTSVLVEGKAGEAFINIIASNRELHKLAQLWVSGAAIDWNLLYQGNKPRRVRLPSYPFARERYWITDLGKKAEKTDKGDGAMLHPMVGKNVSTLREQKYSTIVAGKEFYIADHVIDDKKVLPAAAYIEMACASGEMAEGRKVRKITDMVWERPIVVEAPEEVCISLHPENGCVEFVIRSGNSETKEIVNSRGRLLFGDTENEGKNERFDTEAIINRLERRISGEECYKRFAGNGLNYGSSFRTIKELYAGKDETLALIELPAGQRSGFMEFFLHPSLLDGTFQTVTGIMADGHSGEVFLPFAVDEIDILKPLTEKCYVYAKFAGKQAGAEMPVMSFDICLMDEAGNAAVNIKRLHLRKHGIPAADKEGSSTVTKTEGYRCIWHEKAAKVYDPSSDRIESLVIFDIDDHLSNAARNYFMDIGASVGIALVKPGDNFKACGDMVYEVKPDDARSYVKLFNDLENKGFKAGHIVHLWSRDSFSGYEKSIKSMLSNGLHSVFHITQALMQYKPRHQVRLLYIHAGRGEEINPAYAAIRGFASSVSAENPSFVYKVLQADMPSGDWAGQPVPGMGELLGELQDMHSRERVLRWDKDGWKVNLLKRLEEDIVRGTDLDPMFFKSDGVYLVTGGAGRLGMIFAEYIAWKFKARLVLAGRSELSAAKADRINRLKASGADIVYIRADISKRRDAEELVSEIKSRYKTINGIIHAAGVIRDSLILNKKPDEMEEVIAPKVYGTVWLDELTRDEELDFFVMFSSAAAVTGNAGQADYAFANSFMDYYARHREKLRKNNKRSGRTISFNWPLWQDGGMKLSQQLQDRLKESAGIIPLSTVKGLRAFEYGFRCEEPQLVVFESISDFKPDFINAAAGKDTKARIVTSGYDGIGANDIKGRTERFLKEILSREIKLPPEKIHPKEAMEKYGLDSVMVVNMTAELEKYFGKLPKTLFFEYQSISELSEYFMKNHAEELTEKLADTRGDTREAAAGETGAQIKGAPGPIIGSRFLVSAEAPECRDNRDNADIAIIGVSGRYPMASNLDEFWENLKAGKDCITEVPADRWDYSRYYSSDREEPGKMCSKWGGFIDDADKFDPLFFNISPREARVMDPQERLFMETVWHTIEDAGYTRARMGMYNTGVFVGVMYGQYQLYGAEDALVNKGFITESSYASIANRVSYFFNFKGPSIAIDTMCSSSITAIHLACSSIRRGECDIAIAGGVNLTIHPHKYLILSQGKFLSTDGRCRSFGDGGNGYVPGEGVGAVLLKPLKNAIADRDHIYAVIKGSAVNHGGKTNGYSVPNPNAQADVIAKALKSAGIDPEHISYIEAHGTGTSLGDPIEITGLVKAYGESTKKRQYCAIGSVKSNIGHLESAAGIAGLTKVILQMKHKMLVPSIHSEVLNPNIDFGDTPFYVQRGLTEWKQPAAAKNGKETQIARIAGISSFGAGGSNAHVILEEYIKPDSGTAGTEIGRQIIVISAKNRERLKEYAHKILKALMKFDNNGVSIEETGYPERITLEDIAYTLQIGREAMDERMALLAEDIAELKEKLRRFCEGEDEIDGMYLGGTSVSKRQGRNADGKGEEKGTLVASTVNEGLDNIARAWVDGGDVDWLSLHNGCVREPVSLPGYPFARERHWVPEIPVGNERRISSLHPLIDAVDAALSIGDGITFRKTLRTCDYIVKDHVVENRMVLPGAAHIEMACAAAREICREESFNLGNVVWMRPLALEEDNDEIAISLKKAGEILLFEIRSGDMKTPVIHCKGEIYPGRRENPGPLQRVLVGEIKERCTYVTDKNALYEQFEKNGLKYGGCFRTMEKVWSGRNEALGKLKLPAESENELQRYTLHPALLDGALQTIAGIMANTGMKEGHAFLPYAVEEVEILNPLEVSGYAYVARVGNNTFNIAIMNDRGLVCVKLYKVTVRGYKKPAYAKNTPLQEFIHLPVWKEAPLGAEGQKTDIGGEPGRTVLMVYSREALAIRNELALYHMRDNVSDLVLGSETLTHSANKKEIRVGDADALEQYAQELKDVDIIYFLSGIWLDTKAGSLESLDLSQETGAFTLFRLIKALSRLGLTGKNIKFKIITNDVNQIRPDEHVIPHSATLHGMVKSMAKEYSCWEFACVDISTGEDPALWARAVAAEPGNPRGDEVVLRRGKRYVRSFMPLSLPQVKDAPFRKQGVYLIVGGAGGIGLEMSRYLVETAQARIILVGRSELDETRKVRIDYLKSMGGEVLYIRADVSDPESMGEAVRKAKSRFGAINGVIHSAIVLMDKSFERMDEQSLRSVMEPKVRGSVVLYNAVKGENLDFIMFFSSAQSFSGNPGQGNYAAACAFKDAFARYIATTGDCPVRIINWGYWGTVGIVATKEYNRRMAALGILPINPDEGMETIRRVLGNDVLQVMPIKADNGVLEKMGIDPGGRIELHADSAPPMLEALAERLNQPPFYSEEIFESTLKASRETERLGQRLLLDAFRRMGVFLDAEETFSRKELIERLGIKPGYRRLFDALLDILERAGFIKVKGERIITSGILQDKRLLKAPEELEKDKESLVSKFPDMKAHINLLYVCLERYPEILGDYIKATDVIFPGSSMSLVEGIYKGNPAVDYYNRLVSWSLRLYIETRLPKLEQGEKIKILEVGAGTGGTSAAVFEAIRPYGKHLCYHYTDISSGFIQYGRNIYGADNRYVDFKVLNIEDEVTGQGFGAGEYDIVICANVLHATRNIKNTLRNVKMLLKANGWLVLNEVTQVQDILTMTFGLLDGWWLFDDGENRIKGSPLLSDVMWEDMLREEGFRRVFIPGRKTDEGKSTGQRVIIAESDGMVLRGLPVKPFAAKIPEAEPVEMLSAPNPVNVPAEAEAKASNEQARDISGQTLLNYIEKKIVESVARALEINADYVDAGRQFSEYGVDSITGLELVNRINKVFGITLRTTVIFDYGNASDLANHIYKNYADRAKTMYEAEGA